MFTLFENFVLDSICRGVKVVMTSVYLIVLVQANRGFTDLRCENRTIKNKVFVNLGPESEGSSTWFIVNSLRNQFLKRGRL